MGFAVDRGHEPLNHSEPLAATRKYCESLKRFGLDAATCLRGPGAKYELGIRRAAANLGSVRVDSGGAVVGWRK